MSLGGKAKKVDTTAFDKQTREANIRADEAQQAADLATAKAEADTKAAEEAQAKTQEEIAAGNRARRAAAANRFSLLLFEDETLGA